MRKYFLAFLLMACAPLAHAAVAFVKATDVFNGGGTNPVAITFSPTNAGDLLIVTAYTTAGGGTPTMTVTDNLSDTWTATVPSSNASGEWVSLASLNSIPSGITTIDVSYNGGPPGQYTISVVEVSGASTSSPFTFTPVENSQNPGNTTTDGITSGTKTGIGSGQYLLGITLDNTAWSTLTSGTGYTSRYAYPTGTGTTLVEDQTTASSGTYAATFTDATHGGATTYTTWLIGITAASGGGSCTNSGYEPAGGAIAVPNGTSGSFLSCSGTVVTPNCSSVTYYQPSGGKCGVN